MTDSDLRALERVTELHPKDEGARDRLERARLRHGLGWHGEELPDAVEPAEERGVYLVGANGHAPKLELVYVPGGLHGCVRCDATGKVATSEEARARGAASYGGDFEPCDTCFGKGGLEVEPFYLGRYPTRWIEFRPFGATRYRLKYPLGDRPFRPRSTEVDSQGRLHPSLTPEEIATYDHHPVVNVTVVAAQEFCAAVGLRLPTALEWTWAALGPMVEGKRRKYPWWWRWRHPSGRCAIMRQYPGAAPGSTAPVATWCGAQDMCGNVNEWTAERGLVGAVNAPDRWHEDDVGFRVAISGRTA